MLNIVLIYTSEEQGTLVKKALEGQNHYNLLVQMKLSQWKAILSAASEPDMLLLSTEENLMLGRRIVSDIRRVFPDILVLLLEKQFSYTFLNSMMPLSIDGIVRQEDIRGELLENIKIAGNKKRLEKKYGWREREQNQNLLRANAIYFRQILRSSQGNEALESFLNINQIKRDQTACVADIWIRDVTVASEPEQVRQMFEHILEHLINRFYIGYTFYNTWEFGIHRVTCLFWYKNTNAYGLFTVDGIYRMMLDMIKNEHRDYAFMGLSQYGTMALVQRLYQQACLAGECFFWNQEKDILYYSHMGKYLPVEPPASNGVLYQIACVLRRKDRRAEEEILADADRIIDLCEQIRYNRNDVLRCLQYFVSNYMWWKIENGLPLDSAIYGETEKMNSMISMQEIRAHLKNLLRTYTQKHEDGKSVQLAVRARQILEKRYSENISLQILADQLGVSANYLGFVIKREYAQNFSELFSTIRIEEAKKLLYEKNLTINEIAKCVGIPNSSYFCTVFKRVTGKSPRSFLMSGPLR